MLGTAQQSYQSNDSHISLPGEIIQPSKQLPMMAKYSIIFITAYSQVPIYTPAVRRKEFYSLFLNVTSNGI